MIFFQFGVMGLSLFLWWGRCMKSVICFALFLLFSSYSQTVDKNSIYFKVHEAAKKAMANDVAGVKDLYKMSIQDHGDIELNKMIIKPIILRMIKML